MLKPNKASTRVNPRYRSLISGSFARSILPLRLRDDERVRRRWWQLTAVVIEGGSAAAIPRDVVRRDHRTGEVAVAAAVDRDVGVSGVDSAARRRRSLEHETGRAEHVHDMAGRRWKRLIGRVAADDDRAHDDRRRAIVGEI